MKNRAVFALGRLKTGELNKTEAAYAAHLTSLERCGEIAWHRFEGVKLRLADNTFYTPDFAVMRSDGAMEMHEVKGHWQDDAKVKIKVAAEMYPFRFVAVKAQAKKHGGGWSEEEFSNGSTGRRQAGGVTGEGQKPSPLFPNEKIAAGVPV